MRASDFQFTDPCLSYMNFCENKGFSIDRGREIEIQTNIKVNQTKISENEAVVAIIVHVGDESTHSPFALKVEVMATFRWNAGLSEQNVNSLLKQNAPALLVSYARPIISMITNASHFPAYNIPFINFTDR